MPIDPIGVLKRNLAMARDAVALHRWTPVRSASDAKVARGFSPAFATWLSTHGYDSYAFANPARPAHGGKPGTGRPVVLIHGNSDSAEGWAKVIPELEKHGMRVFAMTVGPTDKRLGVRQYDSPAYVREVRGFIEAVAQYTGQKVDVVGHSLGNLLASRAMVDMAQDGKRPVRNFISVAGGNQGLIGNLGQRFNPWAHLLAPSAPALDPGRPFFDEVAAGLPVERAYGVFGTGDALLNWDATRTGPVPGEERHFELEGLGHFEARDRTPRLLAKILDGTVPASGWQSLVDPR